MHDGKQIYDLWVKAWNEDVSILDEITSPDCTVHQIRIDDKASEEIKGAEALKRIIRDSSAIFTDIKMTIEVGPIVDRSYVSARWNFTGSYKGNMKGAKAEIGERIGFNGMDILFVENGLI